MKVLIDGVLVPVQNDVKIIVGGDKALHVTLTDEGIILDLIEDDLALETGSATYDELAADWFETPFSAT